MSWHPSAKLYGYLVVVAIGVLATLGTARPEPVILAAPFVLAIAAGLGATRPLELTVRRSLSEDAAIEGDVVDLELTLETSSGVPLLEMVLAEPKGCSMPTAARISATALARGEVRTSTVPLHCDVCGRTIVGEIALRATGVLGLLTAWGSTDCDLPLSVHPGAVPLRRLVSPRAPLAVAGSERTRLRSHGTEFADLRPYALGDRARDINWRASARRTELWVDLRHPDRNADVVLVLDAFSEAMLAPAIRAVYALADAYLARRDRVGLLRFGGTIAWIRPHTGARQRHVLVRELLGTSVFTNEADRGIEQIPRGMIPRRALVVAVSPLLDQRMVRLLVDLRARGIDLVVLEVSPVEHVQPMSGEAGEAAYRLWLLEREAQRAGLRELGIPVVPWSGDEPLASAIEEVGTWPRGARTP